ncbi:MAG: hypothetical protein QW594_03265 [Candidatus Woesearchaeota archaeon]
MKFFKLFASVFRKKEQSDRSTLTHPYIAFHEVHREHGSLGMFEKNFLTKSSILLIMGKRGSGKTALGMKFLELAHQLSKRRCFVYGYEKTTFPSWVQKTQQIESLPSGVVLLLDEGALSFSSRDSMKNANKYLSKLMAIARHKHLTLIVITQNSAMIDLNVLRLADVLLFKEPSLLQAEFERRPIKKLYDQASKHFAAVKHDPALQFQSLTSFCYVLSDEFTGMIRFTLPSFWSETISTSYKDF